MSSCVSFFPSGWFKETHFFKTTFIIAAWLKNTYSMLNWSLKRKNKAEKEKNEWKKREIVQESKQFRSLWLSVNEKRLNLHQGINMLMGHTEQLNLKEGINSTEKKSCYNSQWSIQLRQQHLCVFSCAGRECSMSYFISMHCCMNWFPRVAVGCHWEPQEV